MKIKQKILLLLALGTATQAHAIANAEDSLRCARHTITMTTAEDGCSGEYCRRSAFVCVPAAWWINGELSIPTGAKAPLVLAFHGRDRKTSSSQDMTSGLWDIIHDSPEAGFFGRTTNIHGAMPGAITVYFQGLPVNNNWTPNTDTTSVALNNAARGWQVNTSTDISINRDVTFVNKFVSNLIDSSSPLYDHVDMENIYAVGYSNGSRFIGVLWNHTSTSSPLQRSRLKGLAFTSAQAGYFPVSSKTFGVEGQNLFNKADAKTSVFMTMGLNDNLVDFPIQQAAIQAAEDLLGIDLTLTQDQAEDVQGSNGSVKLRVVKHNLANGHDWPAGHENEIADFFNL